MSRRHNVEDLFYDYHRRRRVGYVIRTRQKTNAEPAQRGTESDRQYACAYNRPQTGRLTSPVFIKDALRVVDTNVLKNVLVERGLRVSTLRWQYAVVAQFVSRRCRLDVYILNDSHLLVARDLHNGNLYNVSCVSIPFKDAQRIGAWGNTRASKECLTASCMFKGGKPDFRWA